MRRKEALFISPNATALAKRMGAAARAARLARNISLADFAARARISVSTLNRIERGDPAVSLSSWLATFETGSLLHLLEKVSAPDADVRGRAQREAETRQRASGQRKRTTADKDDYEF